MIPFKEFMCSFGLLVLWLFAVVFTGLKFLVLGLLVRYTMEGLTLLFRTLSVVAQLVADYIKQRYREMGRRNRRRKIGRNGNSTSSLSGSLALPSPNNSNSTTVTSYCKELIDDFIDLADDLVPTEEFLKDGRQAAHKVFELLKQNAKRKNIKVARTIIAGSCGKGTGIWYENEDGSLKNPDFDCVVFVNDQTPPFTTALEAFYSILDGRPSIKELDRTSYSVKFLYEDEEHGDFKVDLLPAMNFAKQTEELQPGQIIGEVQAQFAMDELVNRQLDSIRAQQRIDKEINRLYSSGFCESTVQFVKNNTEDDPDALDVVRLAKFWSINIDLGERIVPGKSCMIELIAIYAEAQQKKRFGRTCLVSRFAKFLELMSDFQHLCITFNNNISSAVQMLGSGSESKPIIIDPANHFNNLAERVTPRTVAIFEHQAKLSLQVLHLLRTSEGYKGVENAIDEIFCHK